MPGHPLSIVSRNSQNAGAHLAISQSQMQYLLLIVTHYYTIRTAFLL